MEIPITPKIFHENDAVIFSKTLDFNVLNILLFLHPRDEATVYCESYLEVSQVLLTKTRNMVNHFLGTSLSNLFFFFPLVYLFHSRDLLPCL